MTPSKSSLRKNLTRVFANLHTIEDLTLPFRVQLFVHSPQVESILAFLPTARLSNYLGFLRFQTYLQVMDGSWRLSHPLLADLPLIPSTSCKLARRAHPLLAIMPEYQKIQTGIALRPSTNRQPKMCHSKINRTLKEGKEN